MSKSTLYDIALDNINSSADSKKNLSKEKTILFIGSKNVGKTTLIHSFFKGDEKAKESLALEYTFGRKTGKNMMKDVCHIWELGGGTYYPSLLNIPLSSPSTILDDLTIILMLDLSQLSHLWLTLETLLQSVTKSLRLLFSKSQIKSLEELQNSSWERIGRDNQDKQYLDPFPLRLIILGGKYDLFQEVPPDKKKVVCRSLRYVAHTLGATLQFHSSKDSSLLRKSIDLLNHHAFDGPPGKIICQDYNQPLIIPAGSDSILNIGTEINLANNHPGAYLDKWKHMFTVHFPQQPLEQPILQEDPSQNATFKELEIDNLRIQKMEEMNNLLKY